MNSMNERLNTQADNRLSEAEKVAGVDHGAVDLNAKITLDDGTTVSVDEMKAGFMRQSDYTKKTQTVAEERKAIELEKALHEQNKAFADTMKGVFENDPDLYNRVVDIVEGRSPSESTEKKLSPETKKEDGGSSPQAPAAPAQPSRNYEYDNRIAALEKQLRQADVDRAASRLQTEFKVPEGELREVISSAIKNFVPGVGYYDNMLHAYKAFQFDKIQEGKAETDRKVQEKRNALMMGGAGPSVAGRQLTDGEAIVQSVINRNPKDLL